jgi:tight adherence protein C
MEYHAMQQRLLQAGLPEADAPLFFATVRLTSLLFGFALAGLILWFEDFTIGALSASIGVGTVGALAPHFWIRKRTAKRQQLIAEQLPDVLHMFVVCLQAGLNFTQALERVTRDQRRGRVLQREMSLVVADLKLGVPLRIAIERFSTRVGLPEVHALCVMITRGAELGIELSELLRVQARTIRQTQLAALEEHTGRANAQLALPLTLCLVPAALIFLAGPALVSLFDLFV